MTAAGDPTVMRLVGAVLWPGFLGRGIPEWLRRELTDGGLAGVVLFSHNLGDAGERMSLAAELRGVGRPLVVGVDEEGGNVSRLEASAGSTLPGAAQLGAIDDLAATEAVGQELAARSLAVGANLVLAPVADVNTDPRNPVIGVRSFGETPELVSRHTVAALRGIQGAGAAACVKHFPGHGDTHLDSHHALPSLTIGLDELERVHLPPFQAAIDAGVAAVMSAHVIVPAWGEQPATLNPVALGRLRAMGFDGVIITDALDMAAVRESVGAGPGGVQALLAGADLLCIGNPRNLGAAAAPDQDERDFREVQQAIVAAVDDGTLPIAVLERAASRVRALAESVTAGAAGERMPLDAHAIARAAITTDGSFPALPGPRTVLDLRGRPTLAVDGSTDFVAEALAAGGRVVAVDASAQTAPALEALAAGGQVVAVDGAAVSASALEALAAGGQVVAVEESAQPESAVEATVAALPADLPADRPLVVLVDRIGAGAGGQRDAVERLAAVRADAVVVNVGVPMPAGAGPGARLPLPVVHTRAASRLAAYAACELLDAGVPA